MSTVAEAELYGSISGPSRWHRGVVVNAELELTARVDVLTGLPNRRHIEEAPAGHISATRRTATPLSILLIDIDHFQGGKPTPTVTSAVISHFAPWPTRSATPCASRTFSVGW